MSLRKKIYTLEDYVYEHMHRLEISSFINKGDMIFEDSVAHEHATAYGAVSCSTMRELFREIRKTGTKYDRFMDIGSGEGKACFYAARKAIASEIIGIEYSSPLLHVALLNLRQQNLDNVNFIQADATKFLFDPGPTIVFMYNPFDADYLEQMITKNLDHFQSNKSVIAYANDCHRHSLVKYGFETIYRNQDTKNSLYQISYPRRFEY